MKKIILSTLLLLNAFICANAMSYEQAREQALFLTDKMAYELNLNQEQYEAAYEINLDYLMDVDDVDDVYALGWRQRNIDMQHIMYDWQYNAFCAAAYFFRPLYWSAGNWHFGIYAHYPHRTFFYFSRPVCYTTYRGAHSWRINGGRSWYSHRVAHYRPQGRPHAGLRDHYRGNHPRRGNSYNRGHNGSYRDNNRRPDAQVRPNRGNYGQQRPGRDNSFRRESSTRRTVETPRNNPSNRDSRPSAGNNRQRGTQGGGTRGSVGRQSNGGGQSRVSPGTVNFSRRSGTNSAAASGRR